jgi:PAS domain-containing protein
LPVLSVSSRQHDVITPQARLAIQNLAAQAAGAILRIQTEAARRESERRFRALAEASFEGVLLSSDGRIQDCNEQLAKLLERTRTELLGRDVLDFVEPEWKQGVRQSFRV